MNIFVGYLGVMCALWLGLYVVFERPDSTTFLNRNQTEILKGYAIMLVLWGHIGQYMGLNGVEFPAGVGVSIFLILSGYGLEKSFIKNRLEEYWKKRLLRVWLPFALCDTVYLIVVHQNISMSRILLNYTFIKEILPFIWYFRFIFVCYLIFWICGKITEDEQKQIVLIFVACSIWFVFRSTIFIDNTPFLEPRQMFCFPVGVLLAHGGGTTKKVHFSLLTMCTSLIIYAAIHLAPLNYENISVIVYNFLAVLTCMVFALGFIFLINRVPLLQNKGLSYIGQVSFEIYVVHRCFINGFGVEQTWFGLGKMMAFTIVAAIALHVITELIRKSVLQQESSVTRL